MLNIRKPCSENWEDMSPSTQGRFCQSCQKNVIDFTSMRPSEIRLILKQSSTSLCGRITRQQLDYYNSTQTTTNSSVFRSWSVVAAISVLLSSQYVMAEPIVPFEISISPFSEKNHSDLFEKTNDTIPKVQGIIITGKVIDINNLKPIPYATVGLENTRFEAKTDTDGYYKLIIPKSNKEVTLTCNGSSHEIKYYKIIPSKDIKGLVISLKKSEEVILGGFF